MSSSRSVSFISFMAQVCLPLEHVTYMYGFLQQQHSKDLLEKKVIVWFWREYCGGHEICRSPQQLKNFIASDYLSQLDTLDTLS
jgi:hypothetical protein